MRSWQPLIILSSVLAAIAVLASALVLQRAESQDRKIYESRRVQLDRVERVDTVLCREIETLKAQIRTTIEQNIVRSRQERTVSPRERARTIRDARAALVRFAARDCTRLKPPT